jgi:hypothetical protein
VDHTISLARGAADAGLKKWLRCRENFGAGEGARTLDPDLGKVVLYH